MKIISITKAISWSYPTSHNANKFGFRDGCWTVSTIDRTETGSEPPLANRGFATLAEAQEWAEALPFPYGRHTYQPSKQEAVNAAYTINK